MPESDPQRSFKLAIADLKKRSSAQSWEASGEIARMVGPDLDYSQAMALVGILKKVEGTAKPAFRLAILGGFTTHQLCDLIRLHLFAQGISRSIYESEYGVYRQEILDPGSQLHAFRPEIVYLAVNRHNLGQLPQPEDTPARVHELIGKEVAGWRALWHAAHDRLGCQIIQDNVVPPAARALSNHEMRHHAGFGRYIALLNLALQDAAPPFVTIHDVDHLSAAAGRWNWADPRFYFQAKLPCAPEMLVGYAHSVATIIAAQRGKARKCMVLDLDDTLWGGVVGDDGIGGILLGNGDPVGEAFLAFQHYVDAIRRRGIILAICSKNDETMARDVFLNHPEMVLRLDHIACFVANWEDKASNLRRIAQVLEIGLDSLVFIDDNPAERGLVRRYLPEVAVPELPPDVVGYIQAIERHHYFQTTSVGTEDLQRSLMYQANAQRREAETFAGSIDDFLASLNMVATVSPVTEANVERVAQLLARSNQFNLTTRRHSASSVLAMAKDPAFITITISLRDRFGDHGLISVLIGESNVQGIRIDAWIMSCRVLKRGVERMLLRQLRIAARARAATTLTGEFIPTAKNGLVRDHYRDLGFTPISADPDGHSWWSLPVAEAADASTFITIQQP